MLITMLCEMLCFALSSNVIGAYNVELTSNSFLYPIPSNIETSYFGYSMTEPLFDPSTFNFSILVGAPASYTNENKGVIYLVTANAGADNLTVEPLPTAPQNLSDKNPVIKSNAALGLNIVSRQNAVVTCSPLIYRQCKYNSRILSGTCSQTTSHGNMWDKAKPEVQECPTDAIDLIFILDGSFSVGLNNFALVKEWVIDLSKNFDIANEDNIGVIQYSHWYEFRSIQPYLRTEITLGQYKNFNQFTNGVRVIPLHGFTTYTAHAINKTVSDFQNSPRFNDSDVAKIMILLTDGNADDFTELLPSSNYARSLGIQTIAVGVGEIKQNQLQVIGNGEVGNNENVFTVSNFAGLQDIIEILKTSIASRLEGGENVNNLEYSEIGISGEFGKCFKMAYLARPYFFKAAKAAGFSTVIGLGLCAVAYKLHRQRNLRIKAAEKRKNDHAEIMRQLQYLKDCDVEEINEILAMKPKDLIQAAQEGKIDPIKILQSYMYKACHDTQELNSICCVIKECYKVASKLSDNEEKGLLYGLPVSIKECLKIKGTDATIGLSSFIGINATEDCVIAQVLKHCGAIPYVKTNIVQFMLSFEGSNPIYGESHNPHNPSLTTGGSSAGEGALVGSGGSPLGFGTDIAGSIRVPAHMCGIAGLKPTMHRISKKGIQGSLPGHRLLSATVGPMAKDVDTLVIAMRALLCPKMFQLDSIVPPLPFNEEIYLSKRKLTIGYFDDNGYNKPIPAIQRALHIAKNALEKAGHTLVKFPVPDVGKAMEISAAGVYADGAKGLLRYIKYDQVDIRGTPQYRKWIISPFIRTLKYYFTWLKSPRIARDDYCYGGGDGSVDRLWGLVAQGNAYKNHFHYLWHHHELDALICPPFPIVAGEKGTISNMTSLMSYTTLFNLLNYSAGVVPVTKVTSEDVKALDNYEGHYGDSWDMNIKTACKNAEGMPVAVQCVAPTWQDEMCLRVMKELESLVQYS